MSAEAKRILITGASGSGKSTLMNQIIAGQRRLIVFDYLPTGARRAQKLRLRHFTKLWKVRAEIAAHYDSFRIWYQPPMGQQIDAMHELATFLWRVQEKMGSPMKGYPLITLAVDEAKHPFPVYSLPVNKRGFYDLCTAGRHMGVNIVAATQRPAQINTELRGNLSAGYFFQLTDAADLDAVRPIGGRELVRFVASAPRYHYCRRAPGPDGRPVLTNGVTRP